MLGLKKWFLPVSSLVLVLGLAQSRGLAADPTVPSTDAKASVTVTVVDADGKPVVGATVSLFSAAPHEKKKEDGGQTTGTEPTTKPAKPTAIATGVTDADGKAILTSIPDGKFRVAARMKHAGTGREMVTVADGKDVAVSVTLKAKKPKGA